ncbi:hypothetical protein FQZ97_778930 [compost metagenome]
MGVGGGRKSAGFARQVQPIEGRCRQGISDAVPGQRGGLATGDLAPGQAGNVSCSEGATARGQTFGVEGDHWIGAGLGAAVGQCQGDGHVGAAVETDLTAGIPLDADFACGCQSGGLADNLCALDYLFDGLAKPLGAVAQLACLPVGNAFHAADYWVGAFDLVDAFLEVRLFGQVCHYATPWE